MSEPVKAGDLAVIIKAKLCGCDEGVGHVFGVSLVKVSTFFGKCYACGSRTYPPGTVVVRGEDRQGEFFAEISRVKRIPPFPELKDERHDEEITA